jgi:hypothetical protein
MKHRHVDHAHARPAEHIAQHTVEDRASNLGIPAVFLGRSRRAHGLIALRHSGHLARMGFGKMKLAQHERYGALAAVLIGRAVHHIGGAAEDEEGPKQQKRKQEAPHHHDARE